MMAEPEYLSTDPTAGAAIPPPSTPGERFAEGAWQNLNPMGLVHAAAHPLATLGHLIDAHLDQLTKAKQLYGEGRYVEAAGHLGAAALPVVGPAAAQAGETIASGDVAGGFGQATGLLASLEVPRAASAASRAVVAPVARVAAALPGTGSNLVGVISPRLAYGLAVAKDIRDAVRGVGEVGAAGDAAAAVTEPASAAEAYARARQPGGELARLSTKEEYAARRGEFLAQRAAVRARAAAAAAPADVVSAPETVPSAAPMTPLADLATPAASPPAAPAPPADLTPPPSAPTSPPPSGSPWSPQRIANEVGLAARRSKLKLSDEQYAAAEDLVRQGRTPADAVRIAGPTPKVKVAAAEMKLYQDLRARGLSHQAALDTVAAQRDLAARLGTPTTEAIRQAVEERNATGRWPDQ